MTTTPNTSTIKCRRCGKPLVFNDFYVSFLTGKKKPLDEDTQTPHKCEY
jgi:hypothetical protein